MQTGCQIWVKSQELQRETGKESVRFWAEGPETVPEAGQDLAAAVLVSGVKSLNWHKLNMSLAGSVQRIDTSLLKYVAAAAVCVFFLGIFLFFLISAHSLPGRHIRPSIIAVLWAFYAQNFFLQAVGSFPLWLLPGRWSDIAGWQSLWDHLKCQVQSIIFYQETPIISPYYQGFLQGLAWLSVSFLFLSLFFALSRKTKRALLIHGILALLAILFYIRHAEQALKPLLYFFPCFIASFRLLFARVHHPPAMI